MSEAEIFFSSVKELKSIVDQCYFDQKGEALSIHKCLKVEQEEENKTVFSSFSPNFFYYQRIFYHNEDSGGTKGFSILPDHHSLRVTLNSFEKGKYKTLTLRSKKGFLTLSADEEYDTEKEELANKNIDNCHQYIGVSSDFPEYTPLSEETYIGSISENNFQNLLRGVKEFGGVEDNNKEVFLFQLIKDRALLTSHNGLNKSAYILISKEGSINTQTKFFLERRVIPKLSGIANIEKDEVVTIYEDEDWVEFRGRKGRLKIKTSEPINQFTQAQNLLVSKEQQKLLSKRVVSLKELTRPLGYYEAKQVIKVLIDQYENSSLNILIPDQQSTLNTSTVELNIEGSQGDWKPILVVSFVLKALIETLEKEIKNSEESIEEIEIEERELKDNPGNLILYLRINDSRFDNEIGGLIKVTDAEYALDQLGADD